MTGSGSDDARTRDAVAWLLASDEPGIRRLAKLDVLGAEPSSDDPLAGWSTGVERARTR